MDIDPLFLVELSLQNKMSSTKCMLAIVILYSWSQSYIRYSLFSFPIFCPIHPPYKTNIIGLVRAIHFKKKISPLFSIDHIKIDFDNHTNHLIQFIHFLQKFLHTVWYEERNLTLPHRMVFKVYLKGGKKSLL